MKNKFILIIIACLFGIMNVNAATCEQWEIDELREEIKDLTFELEYMPKGTTYYLGSAESLIEEDNLFRVSSPNIPESYRAYWRKDSSTKYIVSSYFISFIPGGVYTVTIENDKCGEIKRFQMMVPYYNVDKKNNDVWFDGTYEKTDVIAQVANKFGVDKRLVIILISMILIISIGILFLIRTRRNIK